MFRIFFKFSFLMFMILMMMAGSLGLRIRGKVIPVDMPSSDCANQFLIYTLCHTLSIGILG